MRKVCWAGGGYSRPTFPLHAHGQALLVTAVLTPVSLPLVDQAVLVVTAGVGQVFTYCPLEETLASLTTVHSIVLACRVWTEGWVSYIDKILTHVSCCMLGLCLQVSEPLSRLRLDTAWSSLHKSETRSIHLLSICRD